MTDGVSRSGGLRKGDPAAGNEVEVNHVSSGSTRHLSLVENVIGQLRCDAIS